MIAGNLPKLETLVLTNNRLQHLKELEPLTSLSKLKFLCLLENPVTKRSNYRLFCVHTLPTLKVLDFKKISAKEREEATALFGGASGGAALKKAMVSHIEHCKAVRDETWGRWSRIDPLGSLVVYLCSLPAGGRRRDRS